MNVIEEILALIVIGVIYIETLILVLMVIDWCLNKLYYPKRTNKMVFVEYETHRLHHEHRPVLGGYIAGTYDPVTGISTEPIFTDSEYKLPPDGSDELPCSGNNNIVFGYFDPNEPVKGTAINTGMGNGALFNPHQGSKIHE